MMTEDTIRNYDRKPTFASFLPGIAGIHGIPIWCCYVNRGQGVVSFGVENKDHAIMEFYPAHLAYQNVKRTGFRTFLRRNGDYVEAFADEEMCHTMSIAMNSLTIAEENTEQNLRTEVCYTILPEEKVGALLRRVTITNTSDEAVDLEILDGMPALIPYGVGVDSMKNMTQTAKAWMQAERVTSRGVPFFRVSVSMEDSAQVTEIPGGNFGYGIRQDSRQLEVITDPDVIFGYDLSLEKPVEYRDQGLERILTRKQNRSNLLPCCFFADQVRLAPGESHVIYELIGQVGGRDILEEYLRKERDAAYFEGKIRRAAELVEELTDRIDTKTGDPVFDAYCRYTYMDNVLRGGYPIPLGHNKVFYVYSRKHGDLERDYNYFSMLPEFYSQGNGNFRDVNQNRRMDTFFSPFVERENIHTFYNLIQLDGYNPLQVEMRSYRLSEEDARMILSDYPAPVQKAILPLVTESFTPGRLAQKLTEVLDEPERTGVFEALIDFSSETTNGNFGEGYWSDHWDYNLDLVEEYLSVYPEKEREMLEEANYTFFLSQANINQRTKRYEKTATGVRQYHALNQATLRRTQDKYVRRSYGLGEVLHTTLMEKLILLSAVKFAALDPYGMGIEMEGGKPGWYDALNGLPGMCGSSMNETYELSRHLTYTIGALRRNPGSVSLLAEVSDLVESLGEICQQEQENLTGSGAIMSFWNKINDAKEDYRDRTYEGISGETKEWDRAVLADILAGWKETVDQGIRKAASFGDGICPAYFSYEMTEYQETEEGIIPVHFRVHKVPAFLEGPVRWLKLSASESEKRALYEKVKTSDLYDHKLKMYKVNAPLAQESFEIGRARAFTPGWLENESIWLHMEYKYLLELLKSALYGEFFGDMHHALIPFLDPEVYGRSVLENSSFLASSSNPNEKTHGKGYVARLSGSTVEFLNIWKIMLFGKTPFTVEDAGLKMGAHELQQENHGMKQENQVLRLKFAPAIPAYLLGEDREVSARFLGEIKVTYRFAEKKDYVPGDYQVQEMLLVDHQGNQTVVSEETLAEQGGAITGAMAEDVRKGKYKEIYVTVR